MIDAFEALKILISSLAELVGRSHRRSTSPIRASALGRLTHTYYSADLNSGMKYHIGKLAPGKDWEKPATSFSCEDRAWLAAWYGMYVCDFVFKRRNSADVLVSLSHTHALVLLFYCRCSNVHVSEFFIGLVCWIMRTF